MATKELKRITLVTDLPWLMVYVGPASTIPMDPYTIPSVQFVPTDELAEPGEWERFVSTLVLTQAKVDEWFGDKPVSTSQEVKGVWPWAKNMRTLAETLVSKNPVFYGSPFDPRFRTKNYEDMVRHIEESTAKRKAELAQAEEE